MTKDGLGGSKSGLFGRRKSNNIDKENKDKKDDDSNASDDVDWTAKLTPYIPEGIKNLPDGIKNITIPEINFPTEISVTLALRSVLGMTVVLYVLNQKHLLPRPLAGMVSKTLFWPTLPITAFPRIGKWCTKIDDTVIMGGAPFGFLNYPEKLYKEFGVRAVINFCDEYNGPTKKYNKLGIEELRLPTTDHFEPSTDDLISAISFIRKHEAQGSKVYVHCRGGRGRSGAAVFSWLLYKDPIVDPKRLNDDLCKLRAVRPKLWKQANIQKIHQRLLTNGVLTEQQEDDGDDEDENDFEDLVTAQFDDFYYDIEYDDDSEEGMQI